MLSALLGGLFCVIIGYWFTIFRSMQTIAIVYDPAKREITTSGGYAGATVDNASTQLSVTGIPEGYRGRLEFGVTVLDTNGVPRHPFLDLVDGSCTLTDVILRACRRTRKLPVQLVIENATEVIGSSILTLNVRPSVDAFDAFRSAYKDQWEEAFVGVSEDEGVLTFTDIAGTETTVDVDVSTKPIPVENLVGVISSEHLPAVVFERMISVPDDAARFALTRSEVQEGDTVFVEDTQLMYRVVDAEHLDSEAGYQVYKALQYWGAINGEISNQSDLAAALDSKPDISEGIEPWSSLVVYSSGAVTTVGGSIFISLQSGNAGHNPLEPGSVYWRPYDSVVIGAGAVARFTIGNDVDNEFTLTHSLGTLDVDVMIYNLADDNVSVSTLIERTNVNQVKLTFAAPPITDSIRVVIFKPGQTVDSVNGQTGEVTITAEDVGLGSVDNTSDMDKPVSTAVQTALDLKQDALTFDDVPTDGSQNPVRSDGVFDALQVLEGEIGAKVDAVEGMGLSSNDFTDALKEKLESIDPGSEENKQSDWAEQDPSSDAFIKNKPHVATVEEGIAAWSPSVTFVSGAITNLGGTLYVSLQSGNTGHDPADSTGWWQEIETGGGSSGGDTEVLIKTFIIGDGSATEFTLTHNLGSNNVDVLIYYNSTGYATTGALVERPTVNQVKLTFAAPPTTNELTVVIHKLTDLAIPTDTGDLTNGAGFIVKSVDDLINYYLKSETYTKAEVDALVSVNLKFEVLAQLPTEDISTTTIYLVPAANPHTENAKDEYIYVNGAWELIGSTEFVLSIEQGASGIEINGLALQDASSSQDGLMTAAMAEKLNGVEDGAQANVKPDWNAASGDDDEILNRPVLGTAAFVDIGASAGNVPVLDANGKLADSVVPSIAVSEFIAQVSSKAELVTLSSAQKGDYALVQGDATAPNNGMWILNGTYSTLTDWIKFTAYTPVTSVNGYIGDVVVTATMIGVEEGAEVNVQADWNENDATSDAFIRNRPTFAALGNYLGTVSSKTDLLSLEGTSGDWAVVSGDTESSNDGMYVLNGDPTQESDWIKVDISGISAKADYVVTTITGDGSATEFSITHNLGTLPHVSIYDADGTATNTLISATTTTVTLAFITPLSSGETYTVVITE